MNLRFSILISILTLFCAPAALAQFELKGGVSNRLDKRMAGASPIVSSDGTITGITVRGGGSGYAEAPDVTIAAPLGGGTTAVVTATVSGGAVTSITIHLNQVGSGYDPAQPPKVVIAPPQVPSGPPLTNVQFAGQGGTAASAGAIDSSKGITEGRYPRSVVTINGVDFPVRVLRRATFGYAFASGVPRYFMGDEIERPVVSWDGSPLSNSNYWRSQPVQPGETFTSVPVPLTGSVDGLTQPLVPVDTIEVTESATTSSVVVVSSVPATLTVGATLLGREVQLINGTTLTLSGPANANIAASTVKTFLTYQPYYYSLHADKVYASQVGRVVITWVSNLPDTSVAGESIPTYKFRRETFAVSSAAQVAPRVIYWTEKTFDGPMVRIPTGRIERVNPVFNSFVPGQSVEYIPVGGSNNPGIAAPTEQRTLWFDTLSGLPALRAYNAEGRVFVEYLGKEIQGESGRHEFLGADIVEIRRRAQVETIVTPLGEQLRPREGLKENGDDQISPVLPNLAAAATTGKPLYGTFIRPDGITEYYAERENFNPDNMVLYWMAKLDASLYSASGGAIAGLDISWPVAKRSYLHLWPASLADYEPVNVTQTGADATLGPKFVATSLPSIIFQDDPAELEAEIDGATQRLMVKFTDSSPDLLNRSLLKFDSVAGAEYVRLWIESEDALGSTAVADNLATPDVDESRPAVYTLNDRDGDGARDWSPVTAWNASNGGRTISFVGSRIEAPAGYEIAGHISGGDCYSPTAYVNPLGDAGFLGAAAGAIIPVNALSGGNQLSVWWFKKVSFPAATKIEPFYVPAIAAHYEVIWPFQSQELVIASLKGLENPGLTSVQASGSIYRQPDPTLPGYNPNEEHALLLDGNVYALRDDLNITTSSKRRVLVQYTDPVDSRPAMRVAKVVRDSVTYPLQYDKIAGQPLTPPMPLALLPLPKNPDKSVSNEEVTLDVDALPAESDYIVAEDTRFIDEYSKFTFEDRKGTHWVFRGPHLGEVVRSSNSDDSTTITVDTTEGLEMGMTVTGPGITGTATIVGITDGTHYELSQILAAATGASLTYGQQPSLQPSFGMKFYYTQRAGFDFPELLALNRQPAVGSIQPFIADTGDGSSVTLAYVPKWPDDTTLPEAQQKEVPELMMAQTLAKPKDGLPQVFGQTSAQVLYQQSMAMALHAPLLGSDASSVALHDPIRKKTSLMEELPPGLRTSDYAGKTYFQGLPPNLQNRFYYDPFQKTLELIGEFVDEIATEDYFNLNQLSSLDVDALKALLPEEAAEEDTTAWTTAIDGLVTTLETFRESSTVPGTYVVAADLSKSIDVEERSDVTDPDTAVAGYALSSTGSGTGYVTLVFGNGKAFTDEGDPVQMQIIKVVPDLYPGDLKVLLSSNPLDEKVTVRHSGDYGGQPENFEFRYRYGFNDSSGQAPILPLDNSDTLPDWFDPDNTPYSLGGSILVGADPSAVLSNPAVLMGDVNFTMSYRLKATATSPAGNWSNWTRPALVEGWIKRVLAKITPFNQRVTDLYSNSLNTDVSMITQAGTRWEGDIALNMENINDSGLIEIYETVLNRGKGFTINSDLDTASTNNALILAAGYLNDLYTILGNEAYADGANPTISIDDQDSVTEVNTSRFSFEGQVASSLEEELALLRGRDDFSAQGTSLAPAYNRLWWNFTRGINSGEALYAVNYNIKEKEGSTTANGVVDAADAQRMFPQGHGDAYGHYLTALKGYYKLLTHPYFTWIPSAETVTVLGVPVSVDYKDERKFAAAAANVGRTAQQMLGLVHRQSYQDDPDAGWSHFRDGKTNPRTDVVRHQGMDETASRSTQSAFFHWIVGNAMLPDVDDDPNHSGVQIVDRSTVPELHELPALALSYQTTMDSANGRLNPLGLAPGAIAFDLDPYWNNSQGQELSGVDRGASHYEQISARALRALNNAAGSFNQAATMTRLLRNQENQISDQQTAIEDEEYATLQELLDIYGSPYAGDVGPGKIYPQGYEDPDYLRWMIVDRQLGDDWVNTSEPVEVTYRYPAVYQTFEGPDYKEIFKSWEMDDRDNDGENDINVLTFTVTPNQWVQFADVVGAGNSLGKRPYTGALQDALIEAHLAQVAVLDARDDADDLATQFRREKEVIKGFFDTNETMERDALAIGSSLVATNTAAAVLESLAEVLEVGAELAGAIPEAGAAFLPRSVGMSNDVTSAARGALKVAGTGTEASMLATALIPKASARLLQASVGGSLELLWEMNLLKSETDQDELQAAYEFEQTYRDLIGMYTRFTELTTAYTLATQKVQNLLATGETIRLRRETLRQRAAAVINGYRTKDLTFRTFRNEALVQYRTLFDLAGKYSYLAAKSYDYETGLLGTPQGQAVINRLVASRSLGDLTGGEPQATTSTLGDAGLAGTMAQLNADFAVAEGRLGINNPDHYNTLFSLRQELFRILPHVENETVSADKAWQQTLEQHIVPNVLSDPQVAAYCRGLKKADGTATPGFIIPFSTTVEDGKNFFGLGLAAGDHAYSQSNFSTKIAAVGVALPGYVGTGDGESTAPNALSATPYAYLIPCGTDYMRTPLGDTGDIRSWQVVDQALPLPYNLGASDFNTTQFFGPNDTFAERPWAIRKHQAFRMVADPSLYEAGDLPTVYTNARLIGRSVWNSQWKIVIPAVTLLEDEQMGLNNFAASVDDIKLFLRTYSNSGN
ncbi:hypothetical protein N9255_00225 [bacterium]|nr:hypothetical protein [bacterium]